MLYNIYYSVRGDGEKKGLGPVQAGGSDGSPV